ncbi:flagellar hook assembly protein FlgD [Bacillus sp. FJAT-47783]|uniref:flagellar hook assembly protein FlgD n=1 Tax=Bacillus sp. FJAT-47783 TaxID=2922712 RepID=UPI001FACD79B|nr:flagellar hook assembly protein FlgD [Bacillus sp. FJAT-47783]
MNMKSIDSHLLLSNKVQEQKQPSSSLGKDDFLKILITQLQHQDPLKPMEDREFISQMANFSSLEQMTNMNETFMTFIQQQNKRSIIQYSELIGKEVFYKDEEGKEHSATVQSVRFNGEEVLVQVENESEIPVTNIYKISQIAQ